MNFLNPLVLFGLAASAIPILIHLLNLRRKKKVEFSTLRFLKELQDNKIRKLKIRQWLLLLLRTLIIIFLVLAFARPTIDSKIPGLVSYSKTNAVILLDNSYSMDQSDQFGNRFRRAKTISSDILEKLKNGDMAEVLSLVPSNNLEIYNLKKDLNELSERSANMNINTKVPNLSYALNETELILKENSNLNNSIFIVSDAQKNVFDIQDSIQNLKIKNLNFIKIGADSEGKNFSIDSVEILSSIFQYGKVVEYLVYISNHSNSSAKGNILSLSYNQERVAQISFDIEAEETKSIKIAAPVNYRGLIKGELKLEEDQLSEDNSFYFGFNIPEKVNIATFSDSKQNFMNIALKTTENNLSEYNYEDFPSVDLSSYDIIYLSSGDYSKQDFDRLYKYIEGGGSVFLFDNRISRKEINNFFKNKLGSEAKFLEPVNSAEFTGVEKLHPIFEGVFKTMSEKKIVKSPEIYELNIVEGGNQLINTDYGSFLTERKIGDGKLLYCSVVPDLSASDLPVTGIFPTLLVRSQYYLTASSESAQSSIASGKTVVKISAKNSPTDNFKIIDPNGKEFFSRAAKLPSGSVIILDNISEKGHYSIYNSKNEAVGIIAINHDPKESENKFLSEEEIEEKLKRILGENTNINLLTDPKVIKDDMVRASLGTELWKLFVLLAIICAIAELFVQKIYKSEV